MIQSPIKRDDFKRLDKDAKQIGRILAAVNPGAFDEVLKKYSLDVGDAIHLVICGLAAVGRVEDAENAYWELHDLAKFGGGRSLRDSRILRGHMLKEFYENEEDDVDYDNVIFTGEESERQYVIPKENLENAKWTYEVTEQQEGMMEQIFSATVKDVRNKDVRLEVNVLVVEDEDTYYGDFTINNREEAGCNWDEWDIDTEEACKYFGIEPKTYNVLKKIYSRRNNLG